jgi:hypothetical protein
MEHMAKHALLAVLVIGRIQKALTFLSGEVQALTRWTEKPHFGRKFNV